MDWTVLRVLAPYPATPNRVSDEGSIPSQGRAEGEGSDRNSEPLETVHQETCHCVRSRLTLTIHASRHELSLRGPGIADFHPFTAATHTAASPSKDIQLFAEIRARATAGHFLPRLCFGVVAIHRFEGRRAQARIARDEEGFFVYSCR